jgi:sigma-B regulation protein RsbU (phosphoserine phosphatase)
MEQTVLQRIAESMRSRHRDLVTWLGGTTPGERAIRLGPHAEAKAVAQVAELEAAIEKAHAGTLGECVVCHEMVEQHLLEMDYSATKCLTHLTPEEQSRLEAELELSQKVQKALLPGSIPSIAGWEVSAFSQPASIVGGDYFDFLRFADGAPAVLIADVMGKGMPASMLMASLQATVRILVPEHHTPADVLVRLNRLFRRNISLTKFVTVFIAKLDPGSGEVLYANAGHNPPLLVGRGSSDGLARLMPTGPAIGLVAETGFGGGRVAVRPGEVLVLYTDGVVEAKSTGGIEYGESNLERLLSRHANSPAGRVLKEIRSDLAAFIGGAPPFDDTTLIVCSRRA